MVEKFKYFCLQLVNAFKKESGKYLDLMLKLNELNATAHERKEIPILKNVKTMNGISCPIINLF